MNAAYQLGDKVKVALATDTAKVYGFFQPRDKSEELVYMVRFPDGRTLHCSPNELAAAKTVDAVSSTIK